MPDTSQVVHHRLIFDPASKRYCPSIRAAKLGGSLAATNSLSGPVDRLVGALHRILETPITLSASQGRFMQIVDVIEPARFASATGYAVSKLRRNSIGLRVPIFGSCTGAAWLSAQNEEAVLFAARLCRRALGEKANDRKHILEIGRRVRRRMYAFGGVSPDDATRAIALPLPPELHGQRLCDSNQCARRGNGGKARRSREHSERTH